LSFLCFWWDFSFFFTFRATIRQNSLLRWLPVRFALCVQIWGPKRFSLSPLFDPFPLTSLMQTTKLGRMSVRRFPPTPAALCRPFIFFWSSSFPPCPLLLGIWRYSLPCSIRPKSALFGNTVSAYHPPTHFFLPRSCPAFLS